MHVHIVAHKEVGDENDDIRPKNEGQEEGTRTAEKSPNIEHEGDTDERINDSEDERLLIVALHGIYEILPDENGLARDHIAKHVRRARIDDTEGKERQCADSVKNVGENGRGKRLMLKSLEGKKAHAKRRISAVGHKDTENILEKVGHRQKYALLRIARKGDDGKEDRKVKYYHNNIDGEKLSEIVAPCREKTLDARAILYLDYTFVALRFLAEIFKF